MSAPAPATNAPASSGFLSGLFGAKKANNAPKPANAAAPAVGGRRRASRKNRSRSRNENEGYEERSRKNRNRKNRSRKNRSRSRKNRK